MVKNVIIECLSLMDNLELASKIKEISSKDTLETELSTFSSTEKETILILTKTLKNVINSITRNYLKNFTIERVCSDNDAKIYYADLSRPVVSIKNVTDEINSPIVFKTFFDHLKVPFKNKYFDICYAFETEDFNSIFDKLELPLGLSNYTLALGTVSNYFQIKLLYSEAELFESKFKAELAEINPSSGVRSFFVWRS